MTAPEPGDATQPLVWEKSRRCDTNTCVEVAGIPLAPTVFVRDGKDPDGTVVSIPADDWHAFLDEINAGKHRF